MKKFFCSLFKHPTYRKFKTWLVQPESPTLHVADQLVEERTACFCGQNDSGWKQMERHGIHQLTMTPDDWAKLRRKGRIAV